MKKVVKLSDIQKAQNVHYTDGVSNSTTTYTSATAAFVAADVGKSITGTDIPVGTTIASLTNGTTIVLSQAATGTHTGNSFYINDREVNTIDILVADIPMKSIMDRHVVIPTVILAGPSLSAATARGYIMPAGTALGTSLNVMALTPDFYDTAVLMNLAAPVQLVLRVTTTGAFLSALTAGEIEVHAYYTTLR